MAVAQEAPSDAVGFDLCESRRGCRQAFHSRQCTAVDDAHIVVPDIDDAQRMQRGQGAANGFGGDAQQRADVTPPHAQNELRIGIAQCGVARRKEHEKTRNACFGEAQREQPDHRQVAFQFGTDRAEDAGVQIRMGLAQVQQCRVRNQNQFATAERLRTGLVAARVDAIDTDNTAAHGKTEHLLTRAVIDGERFQEAQADDGEGMKWLTDFKQALAALEVYPP